MFQSTIVKNQTITRSASLPLTRSIHFVNCVFPNGCKLFQRSNYYCVIFTKCVVHNSTARMFAECEHLKYVDVLGLDTSDVFDMSEMFSLCLSLVEISCSVTLNTSNVENMERMFNRCENLERLNISNFDVSRVKSMNRMFYNCKQLQHLNLLNWTLHPDVDLTQMFAECYSLVKTKANDERLASITNDIRATIIKRRVASKQAESELINYLFE